MSDETRDWRGMLAGGLRVDLRRLRDVAAGLRSLGDREVLSAGAAREIGDEIMEAIGETDGEEKA